MSLAAGVFVVFAISGFLCLVVGYCSGWLHCFATAYRDSRKSYTEAMDGWESSIEEWKTLSLEELAIRQALMRENGVLCARLTTTDPGARP